ncbi:CinA family nicotinamide mononucleotide deamidase-related protein [Balneolales bacterium ANBcel1]|nr:CinA family nicotinamide mononucleotide deamidase-related protein [Balneolales bacterium ANBcel1]
MITHSACVLTIGDELLNGDVINTNASRIAHALRRIGVPCRTMLSVADRQDDILNALRFGWNRHDLVIVTGGLGPTRDDVTKNALLTFFDDTLVRDEHVLTHVTDYFRQKGRTISDQNRGQADVPSRASVLFNDLGTAPGFLYDESEKLLAVLPGVPYEMEYLLSKRLIPELEKRWHESERLVRQCYFRTTGIGESELGEKVLYGLDSRIPASVDVAFLPHPQGVDIRVTEINGSSGTVFDELTGWIRNATGEYLFSENYGDSLAHHIIRLLSQEKKTLAVAESCTGGYLADALTDVPGSSACFRGGVVAYENRIKVVYLGVRERLLDKHGAVSAPVALEMAAGVGERMNADFGIATTGVAGPGGGTAQKPVGTVWVGFWARSGTHFACRYQLTPERLVNKERSFAVAMDLLRRHLCGIPDFAHNPEVVRP